MDQQPSTENSLRNKALDEKFCGSCGEIIKIKAEICPKCGVRQRNPLSKTALLLLAFFLGGIGAHKFYTGKNWQGFFYILFCWTGIPSLIALIECIIYALTSSEKLQEKYDASGSGVVIAVIAVIAGAIGIVFVISILAAISIPQFSTYKNRAYQANVKSELQNLLIAEQAYFAEHNLYSTNLEEVNFVPGMQNVTIEIISANENCFEAIGVHRQLDETMSIDCNGIK
ncbi:MAG: NINE protein [Desulfobulbaceae bacterium]|jgi:TM2 domain-containing membrane protein YozV|nr:NINE protein [Desulfobulbaceae bacterium]